MFGHEPPFPLTYEWISLKGEGAMSSSTGVTIGPMDVLELVPSEILRYFIARSKPSKHLEFNTGELLLNLADEYERTCFSIVDSKDENLENLSKRQRVLKEEAEGSIRYSKIHDDSELDDSFKVPFRHLSMLVQIRSNDEDVYSALEKGGYIATAKKPSAKLSEKLSKIRNWIESEHFPDNLRININSSIDWELINNYSFSKDYLSELLLSFQDLDEWRSLEISQAINSPAKKMGLNLGEVYSLLYLIILGEKSGPKLARLLEELEKESICNLISQVVNHKTS